MSDSTQINWYNCQNCNGPLTYIPQYKNWYCYRCKKYILSKQEPQLFTQQQFKHRNLKPKSKILIKIAIAAVIIILLISSSAYFILNQSDKKEKKSITIYEISKIRDLEVLYKVPYKTMSEAEMRELLLDSMDAEAIEQLEQQRLILDALFLLDYEQNLTKIYLDTHTTQILGYYDDELNEMVILERGSDLMKRITLAHELTHALQDQHFNLTAFVNTTNGDEGLARRAVGEGDAMLTQLIYISSLSQTEIEAFLTEIEEESESSGDTPYAIEQIELFPYEYGFSFIWDLYNLSGWDGVNNAYYNPPASTEQVIHIEKYFKYESPLTVEFAPDIQNMTLILNETMGEFIIYIMLDNYVSSIDAAKAAEGWGGDKLYYYKNDKDFLSIFVIEWDSQREAEEFYSTYTDWANELSGNYKQAWVDGCLQIEISQKVTTICYSNEPNIIDDIK